MLDTILLEIIDRALLGLKRNACADISASISFSGEIRECVTRNGRETRALRELVTMVGDARTALKILSVAGCTCGIGYLQCKDIQLDPELEKHVRGRIHTVVTQCAAICKNDRAYQRAVARRWQKEEALWK